MDSDRRISTGLLSLIALALAMIGIAAASAHPSNLTSADCITLDDTKLALNPSGLIGVTLGPVLRSGIRPGFEVVSLIAVESRDRHFVTPWYAVSGLVIDDHGDSVGIATWLSPHLLAVWSGSDLGGELTEWAESPALYPEQTYLFSASRLAVKVSVWKSGQVRAAAEEVSRRCVAESLG